MKEEKLILVSSLVLRETLALSRPRLNIKRLAENAGVSRAWIYKYFGPDEDRVILTAVDLLAPQLTELSSPLEKVQTPKQWAKHFLKSVHKTLEESEQYPELFHFYFHCQMYPSVYGERLRHHLDLFLGQRFVPQVMKVFGMSRSEAVSFSNLLWSTRVGVVLSWMGEPEKTPANRLKVVEGLKRGIFDRLRE